MTDENKEKKREVITTRIWEETPEENNPFAAKACFCSGFDVYGDLLGKVSWIEYLYLLFKQEPPTELQARLLEGLAIVLANPGPRDHSVRAAMNAGVGGSTNASALMSALAVGAGNLGGGREVVCAMQYWHDCGRSMDAWKERVINPPEEEIDTWLPMEHVPGFDPNGVSCPGTVKQALSYLSERSNSEVLPWLQSHREELELAVGYPLSMSGVAAAVMMDLGMGPDQAEMLYLMLRLPGAAAHSLEQKVTGWRKYPFFGDGLIMKESKQSELEEAVNE